jgi:hypothetical protein
MTGYCTLSGPGVTASPKPMSICTGQRAPSSRPIIVTRTPA